MPLTVSPIKKAIVKRALKAGKSAREALKEANYAPSAIRQSTYNPVVKQSIEEIVQELKAIDITPDLIIQRLNQDRELALLKGDFSTATRVDELLGKYIAMFSDRLDTQTQLTLTQEDKSILSRYAERNLTEDI